LESFWGNKLDSLRGQENGKFLESFWGKKLDSFRGQEIGQF
jgi:hypothetical protein